MAAESGSDSAAAAAAAAAVTEAAPEGESARAASIVGLEGRDSVRLHGGVVIPNPSYVVKELVENALDARATLVAVRLKVTAAEGIAEVEVQDNGVGVAGPYDRLACAGCTSKDSGAAGSAHYGFRGYALSAVRSQCGSLVVRTRRGSGSWQVTLRGGEEVAAVVPLPGHRLSGTTVTVASPFAQAPVRRRYWAEKARVKRELALTQYHVLSLSVANPGVTIMLHRDGMPMSAVKKADRATEPAPDTLRGSVAAAVGQRVYSALDEVSAASADGSITATVFLPKIGEAGEAATRSSDDRIITVLNRRPVKWKQAVATAREHHALARPPGAAPGREPVLILSVTMPDADVDLNLCPHKQYAAFRNEASALDVVASALSNQDGFPADNGWCPRGRNGLASSQTPLSSSPSQQDGGGGAHSGSPGASSAGLSQSAKQNLGDLASSLFLTEQGGGLSGAATTFHEYRPDSGSEDGEGDGDDCDTGGRRAAECEEDGEGADEGDSEADSEDEAAPPRPEPPTPVPAAKRMRLQAAVAEKAGCARSQADACSVPPPSPRCSTPPRDDEPAARRRASSVSASSASAGARPRRTPRGPSKGAGRTPPDLSRPAPAPSVEDISGVFQRMFKQQSQASVASSPAEGGEATAAAPCGGGGGGGGGKIVDNSAAEVVRGVTTPPPDVLLCTPVERTTALSQPPPSSATTEAAAAAALPPSAESASFLKGFRTEAGCVALPSADIACDLHAAAHGMLRRSTRVESGRQDVRVGGHAAREACTLAATLLRCDVSVVGFLDGSPAGATADAGASISLAVAEASRRRRGSAATAAAGDEWTTVFCFEPRRLHRAAVLAGLSATHRLSAQLLEQPVVLRHWRGPAGEAFAESQLRLLVRAAKAWGGREASGFKVAVTTCVPCGAAGGEVVLTHLHDGDVVPGFGICDVFEATQLATAHDEEDTRSVLRCTRGRAALAEMARLEADRIYGSGCVEAPSVQAQKTLLLALESNALEQQMQPLLFPLCSVR